jgi:hypothetical protein
LLQVKEKLISSLQQSESSGGVVGEARLEDSRLEREHLQEQLTSALHQLEGVRKDMQVMSLRASCQAWGDIVLCSSQDFEEKSGQDMDSVLEQVRVCEGVLAEEKQQHSDTKLELSRMGQELEMTREDLARERTKRREEMQVGDASVCVCG